MALCPIFSAAKLFGKKWTLPLLEEVHQRGDKGFNALFDRLQPITARVLAKRLRDFEGAGLVQKNVYTNVVPMKTSYYVTDKGKELLQLIQLFKKWQMQYHNDLPCGTIDCPTCPLFYEK
ncbi:MAG TPA: helix-turn-helix domain-containing protein [Candidatus Nanoarchaeia archaeon]|nr:helix-turn-helix domain-containing protein [Candidatus Nanoarchaeia archaeon]